MLSSFITLTELSQSVQDLVNSVILTFCCEWKGPLRQADRKLVEESSIQYELGQEKKIQKRKRKKEEKQRKCKM